MVLTKDDVKKLLPHREPFLFIDGVREYTEGKSIVAFREFSPDEFFFKGHFPGNPIVPGVILMESLAQAGGILVNLSFQKEFKDKGYENAYLMGLDNCKFRKIVQPGDRIDLHVNLDKKRSRIIYFSGQVMIGDTKVAEGNISASLV